MNSNLLARARYLVLAGFGATTLITISAFAANTDTAALERGQYLAEHVVNCRQCHSDNDWTTLGSPPVEPYYKGEACPAKESATRGEKPKIADLSILCTPNITSDTETGVGTWSKTDIINAFRDGIRPDGRPLFPIMWLNLHAISDEDADAIATYIKTLAPISNAQPGRGQAINEKLREFVLNTLPPSPEKTPPRMDTVAYGQYLTGISRCKFCHTPRDAPGQSEPEKEWTGGARYRPPGGEIYSTNLTTHPEGIGDMSQANFIALFRERGSGITVEPKNNTVMPWAAYLGMTDEDLGTIWKYLQTLEPKPTSRSPEYDIKSTEAFE